MDAIGPRPLKRFLADSDDERPLKKFAVGDGFDTDVEANVSSDDDSVYSCQDCPTVILGSDSSSEDFSDDTLSDDESGKGTIGTSTSSGSGFKCFVFNAVESSSEDEPDGFFADESSDTGEASDTDSSNGGLFLVVPREHKCLKCGKTTENLSCNECWRERKYVTGVPPKLKKRSKTKSGVDRPLPMEDACVVCMAEPKTMTLVHGSTAHECVCNGCAAQLMAREIPKRRCPLCRKIFTSVKVNRKISVVRAAMARAAGVQE